ncbi:hypothetical protein [Gimesia aquarii]|uniref:Uncharacterized protein n=1 Tax=Gimesia aquarii TaxID=2527964 RepID=A0A517VZQ2_9PLAN|nr:hypothetical protein [Gimesia aquarii]QDT98478.1 hypothetical protein V144x_39800 [Gimesia aquarii]
MIVNEIPRLNIDIRLLVFVKNRLEIWKDCTKNYEDQTVLLADSIFIESPEELETITEETPTVFMSLDDDEENIGFDDLEDLDDEDFDDDDEFDEDDEDEFDDEDDEFDDDEIEDEDFDDDDDDF